MNLEFNETSTEIIQGLLVLLSLVYLPKIDLAKNLELFS